jgi:putative toxin-antitoxin system antitoxin component (TIGR02293 family)
MAARKLMTSSTSERATSEALSLMTLKPASPRATARKRRPTSAVGFEIGKKLSAALGARRVSTLPYHAKGMTYADSRRAILEGIPPTRADKLADELGIKRDALINHLGLARSVLLDRLAKSQALSSEYSDKLYRAERLFTLAKGVFANTEDAATWMLQSGWSLSEPPLTMARTTPGFEQAMAELDKISYGLPA